MAKKEQLANQRAERLAMRCAELEIANGRLATLAIAKEKCRSTVRGG